VVGLPLLWPVSRPRHLLPSTGSVGDRPERSTGL